MTSRLPKLPTVFVTPFTVDESAPLRRHLNRLEVEVGGEDYRHLKEVELLPEPPSEEIFAAMEEITSRLLETTQNNYNRDLLHRLGIRVYLDRRRYAVYYRLPERVVRFSAAWRQRVLRLFFGRLPVEDGGWEAGAALPGFQARYLPDAGGGVLLLRQTSGEGSGVLLTATHCPYDPHTLEVALHLLGGGLAGAALINLGFSGREPLTDENQQRLDRWGIPLNPSSIDIIYPYADAAGHPFCYKLEENLPYFLEVLGGPPPGLILDLHGCVGTSAGDRRLIVGLGGVPPYPRPADLGAAREAADRLWLEPAPVLRPGLARLETLSGKICVQFCAGPDRGYHLRRQPDGSLTGRGFDPRREVRSLLEGEERTWLPAERVRWLPGGGGNALQRLQARRLDPAALCLHVEIPTRVRRRLARRFASGEQG